MKTNVSRLLIAASLAAAIVLGVSLVRALCLLVHLAPGEHTFVVASYASFVRALLVSLSPLVLYAVSFTLDSRVGRSRFGKLGFVVQVIYGLVLAVSSIYLHHVVEEVVRGAHLSPAGAVIAAFFGCPVGARGTSGMLSS